MAEECSSIWVGYGGIARVMMRTAEKKEWLKTVGIVDVNQEALAEAGSTLSLSDDMLFTDLKEALAAAPADTVVINTPSHIHYDQVRLSLEAGKHVLVAKPFTNDFEQAKALVELAEKQNLKLGVNQQVRYNRHYTAVRRFLATGRLGSVEMVFLLNAKPRRKVLNLAGMEQPVLFEWSCHHFDSLMSLFPNRRPVWVQAQGFRPSWSVYDGPCSINGFMLLEQNLNVLYHAGFSSQADMYELRLEGSEGVLRCRGRNMNGVNMRYELAMKGGSWEEVDLEADLPENDPFGSLFDAWRKYVTQGSEPPFSGRKNLAPFALLGGVIESVQSDGRIEILNNPRYIEAFSG